MSDQIYFIQIPHDPKIPYVNGDDCPQNPNFFYLNIQNEQLAFLYQRKENQSKWSDRVSNPLESNIERST